MNVAEPVIEGYLAALEDALTGPGRARRDLLAEARDHLLDATEAYQGRGWDPRAAAERAVQDFGPVTRVAEGYQQVLAVAASRRSALTLVAFLLPQAFLWDNGLRLAPSPAGTRAGVTGLLDVAVEWFGFGALVLALVMLVIAGIGQRWVTPGRGLARWTGVCVGAGALGSAGLGLGLLLLSGAAAVVPWALVLLVLPMAWTVYSARLCLRAA